MIIENILKYINYSFFDFIIKINYYCYMKTKRKIIIGVVSLVLIIWVSSLVVQCLKILM